MTGLGLRLAWRNLWRHPRRTVLTLAAIAFSNVLLVFMISLQVGTYGLMIDNSLQALTGHLQVQADGWLDDHRLQQVVPDGAALAADLRAGLGLAAVSQRAVAHALLSSEERSYGAQLLGVDPEREPLVSSLPGLLRDGRWLANGGAAEIVLGSALARNLRVAPGDRVTLLGSARDGSFAASITTVAGVFDSGIAGIDRGIAMLPFDYFGETFAMRGAAHQVVIVTPALEHVPEYEWRAEALLPASANLVVLDWDVLQPGLKQAIRADIGSAFFVYAVLVVLVAFSVLNTQLMSVLERTKEFGIHLALGISPGRLGNIVLTESALLGGLGLLLGMLLGAAVTAWFGVRGFAYPGMEELAASFNLPAVFYPQLNLVSVTAGPGVVFVFTLLAALYPALRLHWLEPVAAMRAA